MDKLKKQIFTFLTVLLLLSAGALVLLLKPARSNAPRAAQTPPSGKSPLQTENTVILSGEEKLARLLGREKSSQILTIIKTRTEPFAAYPLGMSTIISKHNQLANDEIQEYKQTVQELWNKYHPQTPQAANEPPAPENTPQQADQQPAQPLSVQTAPAQDEPHALPEQNKWKSIPCKDRLPAGLTPEGLSCMESELGFCARFDNGRPYFCQTRDGRMQYMLNKWGSALTVKENGPVAKTFYYANGKLTRYSEKNPNTRTLTQVWLSNGPLRMTRTNFNGNVLDKYYFTPDKPYVRYPAGNDMGEQNGPWEEKDGQIWTDGHPLFTLPPDTPAPDVCRLFPDVCKTQDGKELL